MFPQHQSLSDQDHIFLRLVTQFLCLGHAIASAGVADSPTTVRTTVIARTVRMCTLQPTAFSNVSALSVSVSEFAAAVTSTMHATLLSTALARFKRTHFVLVSCSSDSIVFECCHGLVNWEVWMRQAKLGYFWNGYSPSRCSRK